MEGKDIQTLLEVLKNSGYELKSKIGQGATADVYTVHELNTDRIYACKVGVQTYFLQAEATLLRQITHPLFPEWKEYLEFEDLGFLIMEYVGGSDLEEYLKRRGRLSVREAVRIALELADGIGYLHELRRPVYYRDLKPANVVIGQGGDVRLLDLGAAAINRGWKAGTKGYAAPEILGEGVVQPGSDVYTLGMVMHYMLTGCNPCLQQEKPAAVRKYRTDIPRGLEDIIKRCICEEPKERIPGMRELLRELSIYDYRNKSMAKMLTGLKREVKLIFQGNRDIHPVYEKSIWLSVYK